MVPRNDVIDFTEQASVERMLMQQACQDGHCMDSVAEAELRRLPGNDVCVDCGKPDPEWASVNLGVFMCLGCSGQHRALGTHISFVRSVKMDSWSDSQLKMMFLGGNQQCTDYLMMHGLKNVTPDSKPYRSLTIKERYDCAPTLLYQQILQARRDGQPEPTELPDYTPAPAKLVKLAGFGNSPAQEQKPRLTIESAMAELFKNNSPVQIQKPRLTIENAMSMFKNMTNLSKQ